MSDTITICIVATGNSFGIEGRAGIYGTSRDALNAAREIGRVEQAKAVSHDVRQAYEMPLHDRQSAIGKIFPNPFDKDFGVVAQARREGRAVPDVTVDDAALTTPGAEHPDVAATRSDKRRKAASRKRRAARASVAA